ncbi:MAG: ABC transporter substrate-binding protein [Chloroflexota bacterium]
MEGQEDTRRAFTRRRFLQGAASAASMAGLGTLLAACASTPAVPAASPAVAKPTAAPAAVPTAAQAAAPAKPKRGGTLRIAMDLWYNEGFLTSRYSSITRFAGALPFEFLLYYDPKDPLKLTPGLAESWNTKDNKTWTFKIRKGVPWDKGYGEVTAEDVAFTVRLLARKDSKYGSATFMRELEPYIEVPDPYTLIFRLPTINDEVDQQFSPWGSFVVLCKKYVETVGEDAADRNAIGTGPYRLTKLVQGTSFDYEASGESHWRVPPMWDGIHFDYMPEATTRFAMLQTKRAELAPITVDQIQEAKAQGFVVIQSAALAAPNIYFGGQVLPSHPQYKGTDPWRDVRVREAMSIAIDREAINKGFFGGLGTFEPTQGATLAPLSSIGDYRIPYDPARAKQLLKEAGKEGFSFEVMSFVDERMPDAPGVMQAAAGYWEAIGLKPRITPMDKTAFRNTHWINDSTSGKVWPWALPIKYSPYQQLQRYFTSKEVGFKMLQDPFFDNIFEQLKTEGDPAKRADLFKQAHVFGIRNWATISLPSVPIRIFAVDPAKIISWDINDTGSTTSWEYIAPKL